MTHDNIWQEHKVDQISYKWQYVSSESMDEHVVCWLFFPSMNGCCLQLVQPN